MSEYTELLCRLIECRPVTADIPAVNRAESVMRDFLERHGLYCTTEMIGGRQTLYASTRPGKVQDVLLNAHLDVVPASDESQFTPCVKDGWLYARGAGDCLGDAVCIASFLCENKDEFRVGAFFSSDEETGGETTRGMVERGYGAAKAVLVLDHGGDYNITYAQKGILVLKVTARSRGGHSSAPWAFRNPIDMLADAYQRLRGEWVNPVSEEDWRNSMAPCVIAGGDVENRIPDTAEMVLNFRYVADEDCQKIIDLVVKTTGLEVSVLESCPPVSSDVNAPAMQLLRQAFQRVLAHPVGFIRMCGATDARHLRALNIPVAIIGTEGTGAHSPEDRLKLESIDTCRKILKEYMTLLQSDCH